MMNYSNDKMADALCVLSALMKKDNLSRLTMTITRGKYEDFYAGTAITELWDDTGIVSYCVESPTT